MKLRFVKSLFAIVLVSMLAACNGTSSSSDGDSTRVDEKGISMPGEANKDSSRLQGMQLKPAEKWTLDTALRTPESALWNSKQRLFYVSNINGKANSNDGSGFISQVGPDGKIIKLHWIDGLNAPKGLGMYNGILYVADLEQLVLVDVASAKVKQKITAPGATFLNDVAVDDQGTVYISDTRQGKVYRYADNTISVFIDKPEVKDANGLMIWNDKLWILTGGGLYHYDPKDQKLTLLTDGVKGGDGLALYNDSTFIASRWIGEIYAVDVHNGKAKKLLDTKGSKNTADISYVPELQLLIVPTFEGNTLDAYRLEE